MIFLVMIETRPIPWKSPKVSKRGVVPLAFQQAHYQRWAAWLAEMRTLLSWAWNQGEIRGFSGPCDVDILAVIKRGGSPPDRMNIGKSAEDLLQGIVFPNDTVVRGGDVRRVFMGDPDGPGGGAWEGPERLHIRVTAPS